MCKAQRTTITNSETATRAAELNGSTGGTSSTGGTLHPHPRQPRCRGCGATTAGSSASCHHRAP
uniref:Uncharacterized protein n=1 Tax=Arundo donax TaxID=35708 RepID=A0A0A9D7D2_ARUDO